MPWPSCLSSKLPKSIKPRVSTIWFQRKINHESDLSQKNIFISKQCHQIIKCSCDSIDSLVPCNLYCFCLWHTKSKLRKCLPWLTKDPFFLLSSYKDLCRSWRLIKVQYSFYVYFFFLYCKNFNCPMSSVICFNYTNMTLKQNSLMHEDTPTQHSQRNNTYKARSTQSFDNVLEMQKKKMLSHWTTKVLLSKPEKGPNHRKKKNLTLLLVSNHMWKQCSDFTVCYKIKQLLILILLTLLASWLLSFLFYNNKEDNNPLEVSMTRHPRNWQF